MPLLHHAFPMRIEPAVAVRMQHKELSARIERLVANIANERRVDDMVGSARAAWASLSSRVAGSATTLTSCLWRGESRPQWGGRIDGPSPMPDARLPGRALKI